MTQEQFNNLSAQEQWDWVVKHKYDVELILDCDRDETRVIYYFDGDTYPGPGGYIGISAKYRKLTMKASICTEPNTKYLLKAIGIDYRD